VAAAHSATKVAIHFDVDTIDANEIRLGLGADFGGLTSTEARRVVADIEVRLRLSH
jgi:arginase